MSHEWQNVNGEHVVAIANAIDLTLRLASPPLDVAMLGTLVFLRAFLERIERETANDNVPMPTELLAARAAIEDFLKLTGIEIEHDL
jgi:hypothetical protein